MASRVEALVRSFLRSDGEALYLVPGERIFMMRGTSRAVVGREPLSPESFESVTAELVPGASGAALAAQRHLLNYRLPAGGAEVEVRFGIWQGAAALMVSRVGVSPAAADPATRRPAPAAPTPPSTVIAAHRPAPPVGTREPSPRRLAAPEPARLPPPPEPIAAEELVRPAPAVPRTDGPASIDVPAGELEAPSSAAPGEASFRSSSGRPLDDILVRMVGMQASDLHLSSAERPIYRIHGEILPQRDMPVLYSDEVERLVGQILPEKHRQEFSERNDTDFAYEIEGVARFRVNVFRDRRGVGAVFRQIPIEILTTGQLKLPPAVVRLGDLSKGLVLVTGPTGSGKSTTLAAIVDYVNETRSEHIITIEDPIEFVHRNKKCLVNQREVGSHTRGFKDALRAALREDPDVVLVGEMRDLVTIAIAIETAETGHLVFGTLHTTTATSAVDRIIDQFPADRQQQIRVMLADSLKGVVAQTLCRRIEGGRVAALEILLSTNAISNLIRDGKTFQLPSVLQTSKGQGMILLNDSLLELVKTGQVAPREAYIKAVDKNGLLSMYRSNDIPLPTETAEAAPSVVGQAAHGPAAAVSSARGGKPS